LSEDLTRRVKRVLSESFEIDINDITEDLSHSSIPSWRGPNHIRMISNLEKEFDLKFEEGEKEILFNYKNILSTVLAYLD
tara:strand:+ start:3513 stop:3752 length:240 start_codon:yes stop_codon:yes gene_type:complete